MAAPTPSDTPDIAPQEKPPARWGRRLGFALLGIVFLIALLVLIVRVILTQSIGHRFVENQINSRSFGPLESIQITGLDGDLLSNFTVQSVKILDKDGLWFTAQNVSLDYRALPIFSRHLFIQDLTLGTATVLRRPVLNTVEDPKPLNLKITLDKAAIPNLNLAAPVIGQALSLDILSAFNLSQSGDAIAQLKATRTDTPETSKPESLSLDFSRKKDGTLNGDFNLSAGADGPFAKLMKAPKGQSVQGSGTLSGDRQNGTGDLTVSFDETPSILARADWTAQRLVLKASLPAKDWALLAPLKALKSKPDLSLTIDFAKKAMPFQLAVKAGQLDLNAKGVLPDPDKGESRLPTQADINLSLKDPAALLTLPEGYGFKDLKLAGSLSGPDAPRFAGQASVKNLSTPYANAASIAGPLSVTYSDNKQINFDLKPRIDALEPLQNLPIKLERQTDINLSGQYNTNTRRLNLRQANITSGAQTVTASGRAQIEPLSYDMTGAIDLSILQMGPVPSGALKADYKIQAIENATTLPALSVNGTFNPQYMLDAPAENLSQDLIQNLVGKQLSFDVQTDPLPKGLNIQSASFRADGFKAEASGTVTDTLDLALEADILTALTYADITLEKDTTLSGNITGSRDDPNIKLDAQSPRLDLRGYEVTKARLRTEIKDVTTRPTGPVRVNAVSEYGDIDLSVNLASTETAIKLQDITANLGPLSVKGGLEIPQGSGSDAKIATGALSLDLPKDGEQFAVANLELDNRGGEQGLKLEASAKNIAYKDIEFDSFTASGSGTLQSFMGEISTEGQSGSGLIKTPFTLKTPITLSQNQDAVRTITLVPNANYGRVPLRSKDPLVVKLDPSGINVAGAFTLRDGSLGLSYQSGQSERVNLELDNIPVNLLPLPTALSETRGQVKGALDLGFENGQITGDLSAEIMNWRGFDRKDSEAVTLNLKGLARPNGIAFDLSGTSPLDFDLDGSILVPVTHEGSLASIRPNMDTPISGTLKASGASAALLGLVTPKDAELQGRLEVNLDVSGTLGAPNAQGQMNGANLRFEAPELGTQIRDGRFALAFTNNSLTLTDLYASSAKKGSLTGSGAFKLGEYGRPLGRMVVDLDNFDVLDRRDLSAKLSGDVSVEVKEKMTEIGGDVTVLTATLKQFASSSAGVIDIEVEEINVPKSARQNSGTMRDAKAPALPVNIDLNVKAPRRIFVRSKGLDVELSLDTQIKGTLDAPLVFGTANILRGGFTIASKTLDFDTGNVQFDGDIAKGKIDFSATTQTQNLDAKVEITGTVEDPEITLSSSPSRPQDEILSAILFGRSATELSAIEAAQLAGAIAQFSGSGGLDLLGGVRDALGIGQLSIGVNDDGGAVITGGRYLAKNVYLQVFSGVGSNDSGAVIDWDLRKNISLRSRLQSDNDQSLSIKWKRDF